MDGAIHAATQGKGNFTPKQWGKIGPRGKKSSRFLALVENLEVLGGFRQKKMRERVVGGDFAPLAEGVFWKSPEIMGMHPKMNENPIESPDLGSQLWDFTPKSASPKPPKVAFF